MKPTASSLERFASLVENSSLIKTITRYKNAGAASRLFGDKVRSLTKKEIQALTAQGNFSADWPLIKVALDFSPEFVRGNTLVGACALGAFCGCDAEAAPGVLLPNGLYSSTIVASEIGSNCLVRDCGLIANYLVESGAILVGVGALSAGKGAHFGNGTRIRVGSETGGRDFAACAEIAPDLVARIALERGDKDLLRAYEEVASRYREAVTADFGVVEAGSVVRLTTEIRDSFIGAGARIEGATLIENSTILSGSGEEAEVGRGAIVRNSCLQWRSKVDTHPIVIDSLLFENTRVERHAKVSSSAVGPNATVAEGEVTASLVGPFTGFHHQALLIGALWPAGRGNVAYGANIGSNHTSRLSDQELFCGEGVFFGLGTSVKFPADFSRAPYSIVATGVTTLPQRLEFPFSLVASPSRSFPDLSPALNELSPGWVLSDNIYMVGRNEVKCRERNQAMRSVFDFPVFRPVIVDLMVEARNRLRAVKEPKSVYTDRDIIGLGKNYLTEERRQSGLAAYDFYLEYYCLDGLVVRLEELSADGGKGDAVSVYSIKTDDEGWEHRRGLLVAEGWDKRGLSENLNRLIAALEKIARDIFRAKAKDDERGAKIIPDYDAAAVKADDDEFVVSTRAGTAERIEKIKKLRVCLTA